jgi:hypothetical protein
MDAVTGALLLKAVEYGANMAIAYGSAQQATDGLALLISKGLTLEEIDREMDGHVAASREKADAALKAKGT